MASNERTLTDADVQAVAAAVAARFGSGGDVRKGVFDKDVQGDLTAHALELGISVEGKNNEQLEAEIRDAVFSSETNAEFYVLNKHIVGDPSKPTPNETAYFDNKIKRLVEEVLEENGLIPRSK